MAYVVLTRDADSVGPYAAALAPLGLEPIAMPVTRTELPHDRHALLRAVELGGYAAILIQSARAAAALLDARGHAPMPEVWAIGTATAAALQAAGLFPIVPAEARDGATLARALLGARALAGKRVLVPRAEDGRDDAIEILRAAGVEVHAVTAYRTVPVDAEDPAIARGRELLAGGGAAVTAVFAPSQVAALARLGGVREIETCWVAIGETTAAALRDAGAELIAVAGTPTPEGIAKAVAAVYPHAT